MTMSTVQELGVSMQTFGWPDFLVFAMMLLLCAGVGIYFGFCVGKTSTADYLMGGRNMMTFPVAMSLIASFNSGVTLIGTPTEIYVHGSQYLFIIGAVILMGLVMGVAILPVLHDLQLTSTYEYLETRFDQKVRLLGSFMFTLSILVWMPIVIYVPALAFNQVTGINVHVVAPAVCLVCIFYTCVGGLRAVVWTDVIQTVVMFGAMIIVIVKGTVDVGGVGTVWQRNYDSGRLEQPNFSPDPLERNTVWSLTFGGFSYWLQNGALMQTQAQRYLALPKLKSAQTALWIFVGGSVTLVCICSYCGMLIFATYHNCDPLTTKLAVATDQLLPLFVMDTLGEYPGVPGLFVAGVFSAALSTLSTGLNSMATVVLEDFYKTFSTRRLTDRQTNLLIKAAVVVLGGVCVGLVFVVERLGSVLQASISLSGITDGVSVGLFYMGMFLPWVTAKGALSGGVAGLVFMTWVIAGAQTAIADGHFKLPVKPVSVEGCTYNFTYSALTAASSDTSHDVFALYRISYLWYNLLGASVTICVGLVVSFVTGCNTVSEIDPKLLSPVIRRFLSPHRKDNKMELQEKEALQNESNDDEPKM